HSLDLLQAMRTNTGEEWLHERVRKYGPISRLSLFGKPAVFIHGQATNELVFSGDSSKLANKQTASVRAILGDRNLMELSGQDHKRVGKMDEEVRKHIELHWQGKEKVAALLLMKNLTFNIICSLLFGLEERAEREKFLQNFQEMIDGVWSIPVKLPFTHYSRSLHASSRVQGLLKELVQEKKEKLEQRTATPHQDLITCLLSKRDEENKRVVTDKEILHNIMLIMVAGHDTSSGLMTFMLRLLRILLFIKQFFKSQASFAFAEQEIAKSKTSGEPLTWEDLARMKYTWRVEMETLRMVPPVFAGFRVALKDIDYGGYLIPKGWQIFWASSTTHMDESIFPEPSKFELLDLKTRSCFVAFGGGPRICPGNEFARIETLVAIHQLVTQYSWELCSDDHYIRDPMPVPTQGLLLQIVPKKQK
ncbi:hypothetical protein EUGRSUZ_F00880, partial [Eucalyptus grandis]